MTRQDQKSERCNGASPTSAKKPIQEPAKRAVRESVRKRTKITEKKVPAKGTASKGASLHEPEFYLRDDHGFEVTTAVRQGIFPAELRSLIERGYSRSNIVHIIGSRSTIERRERNHQRLNLHESDRLARLMRIISQAEAVFGSPEKARHWMERPSVRLPGGESPLSLLDTDSGAEAVSERLVQIQYGIFA